MEESLQAYISDDKMNIEEQLCENLIKETSKENEEEQLLQMAINDSLMNNSKAIAQVLESGFPYEMAMKAYSFVGEDYQGMIDFILANLI